MIIIINQRLHNVYQNGQQRGSKCDGQKGGRETDEDRRNDGETIYFGKKFTNAIKKEMKILGSS
jgi:hypothetical protein